MVHFFQHSFDDRIEPTGFGFGNQKLTIMSDLLGINYTTYSPAFFVSYRFLTDDEEERKNVVSESSGRELVAYFAQFVYITILLAAFISFFFKKEKKT